MELVFFNLLNAAWSAFWGYGALMALVEAGKSFSSGDIIGGLVVLPIVALCGFFTIHGISELLEGLKDS